MAFKSRSISLFPLLPSFSPRLSLTAEMEDAGLSVVEEEEKEDFFERFEAPKFFDFTIPEISRPDQSSWFCTRIGCDQNHEMVEPGELNRSFMIRVMAARSPNVRFQRTLNRQCLRAYTKCPQSAPAKSTKNGNSRMSTMSSIAEKNSVAKLKQHPINSLRETPIQKRPKVHILSSKKEQTTTDNNKATSDTVMAPKDRNLVKALFSHTPKKAAGSSRAPISEICSEKKKKMMIMMNTDGERKHMSRGSCAMSSRKCKGSSISSTKTRAVCSKFKNRRILKEVSQNEIKDVQFGVENNDLEHVEEKNNILVKSTGQELQSFVDSKFEGNSEVSIKPGKEEIRSIVLKVSSGSNVKNDDDKENTLFTFENKNMRTNAEASEGKSLCIEKSHPQNQKSKVQNKGFHGAKNLKRTTNPKPFRLRTDERGILKEANLERKLQVESKKEPVTLLKHLQRKQTNSQAILAKTTQTQKLNSKKEKIIQDAHAKSSKTVSTKQPQKIKSETRERRESISRKFKERGGLIKKLQGKKLATTAKEPKFHRIHVPKNCTRRYEMAVS